MNKDIMLLSNTLIYDHKLRCGTAQVAESSLDIPDIEGLHALHASTHLQYDAEGGVVPACINGDCWLKSLLDPR